MSYTKEGYDYMAKEVLDDFITTGVFIEPGAQHYTSKSMVFKSKIAEILSSEINRVILTNIIDPNRYRNGALDIWQTICDHEMHQEWVTPDCIQPIIDYLQYYIESKCESTMRSKKLYEKAKQLIGEQDEGKR